MNNISENLTIINQPINDYDLCISSKKTPTLYCHLLHTLTFLFPCFCSAQGEATTSIVIEENDWGPEPKGFPDLVIESEAVPEEGFQVQGRRIVNIAHIMKQMEEVGRHSLSCTTGRYKLKFENRNGVACSWTYKCDNCERQFVVTSEPADAKNDVNSAVVWGSIAIGTGYSQTEEFLSVLDIPIMSEKKFANEEVKIEEVGITISLHAHNTIYCY